MKNRTRLLRVRRDLHRRLSTYARAVFGAKDSRLARYASAYQREFQDFEAPVSRADLLRAVRNADVVFCGDYHTLERAQRTTLKLLQSLLPELRKKGRKLVLGLEMLRASDNAKAKDYLQGKLSEKEFLAAIDFKKVWGFEWKSYRPFFDLARREKFDIVGVNRLSEGVPALKARDRFAAKVVADLSEKHPRGLALVVMGDMHLARQHLPGELERQFSRRGLKRRIVVIHQNLDKFYWKLVERGLEDVEVLRVRDGVYCVMSAAPWVKLRSHIHWAELTMDDGEEPLPAGVDAAGEISELASDIARFVGLQLAEKGDFEVVDRTPTDPFLRRCVKELESFFVPGKNSIYLSYPSVNQAAACAAIYVHARASGSVWKDSDVLTEFYPHVWREALAFFGSKIINPKRAVFASHDSAKIASLEKDLRLPKRATLEQKVFYYKLAKLFGRRLGEGLYAAAVGNLLSRSELKALYETNFKPAESRRLYRWMVRRLDRSDHERELDTRARGGGKILPLRGGRAPRLARRAVRRPLPRANRAGARARGSARGLRLLRKNRR